MNTKTAIEAIQRLCRERGIRIPARLHGLRTDRGDALIELALSLTVLTLLIVGTAEGGFLAYSAIEVSNAAHAGATYGSQDHATADDSSGMQTAAIQDAHDVSGITATASRFCKCSGAGTSTCAVTDCSSSRIVEYVQVNTTASVSPPIKIPGSPSSYTFTGKAIMRVLQ
jgi:Flp pilus assembly protein TadG